MNTHSIKPDLNWSDVPIYSDITHFVEIPNDASSNLEQQLTQILHKAEQQLFKARCNKSNIISVNIYLANFDELSTFNRIWSEWMPKSYTPSRAYLKAEFSNPEHLVEIGFIITNA